ncbi:hypothetical protein PoB_006878900 [Plakobranchus ocellatus]|uniref:Apple domain-containing protein n=1 Tax=Plakobranchus ocellatus TaxID=259542 RepID=A0AAV4DDS8_9GAST|nr:hypothetical protein PoB_006878900 [Plakobranchus ocellatus]
MFVTGCQSNYTVDHVDDEITVYRLPSNLEECQSGCTQYRVKTLQTPQTLLFASSTFLGIWNCFRQRKINAKRFSIHISQYPKEFDSNTTTTS